MDYERLSSESLENIMTEIRKANGKEKLNKTVNVSGTAYAGIKRDAELEEMETMMSEAAVGTQIGLRKAEMSRQKGVKLIIARFIEKIFIRVSEITNRDVRKFNSLVLTLLHCVCGKLEILFFNDQLLDDKLSQLQAGLDAQQQEIGRLSQLNEAQCHEIEELKARLEAQSKKLLIADEKYSQLDDNTRAVADAHRRLDETAASFDEYKMNIGRQCEQLSRITADARSGIETELALLHWSNSPQKDEATVLPERTVSAQSAVFYHDLEERFRGSQNDIRRRLEAYIPLLLQRGGSFSGKTVLDLGCGRGEMMDVLRDNGADCVVGLDLNPIQLQICREKGHTVIEQDCLAYLSELKSGSVDYIFAIQLIEHLPFDTLLDFFSQCGRVLKKGGIILCETPNCENLITSTGYFYIDPSHQHPIHPELARFIAQRSGFSYVEIIGMNENEYSQKLKVAELSDESADICTQNLNILNKLLYGPQDYALLGIRA